MFVTKDGDRLYLGNFEYNLARILTELRDLVTLMGGHVAPHKEALVTNRAVQETRMKLKSKIEALEKRNEVSGPDDVRSARILDLYGEMAELPSTDTDPIRVVGQSWIKFTLDGWLYDLNFDENPFFRHYYSKRKLDDAGRYATNAYVESFVRSWMGDELLSWNYSRQECGVAALRILEALRTSKPSRIQKRPEYATINF